MQVLGVTSTRHSCPPPVTSVCVIGNSPAESVSVSLPLSRLLQLNSVILIWYQLDILARHSPRNWINYSRRKSINLDWYLACAPSHFVFHEKVGYLNGEIKVRKFCPGCAYVNTTTSDIYLYRDIRRLSGNAKAIVWFNSVYVCKCQNLMPNVSEQPGARGEYAPLSEPSTPAFG